MVAPLAVAGVTVKEKYLPRGKKKNSKKYSNLVRIVVEE